MRLRVRPHVGPWPPHPLPLEGIPPEGEEQDADEERNDGVARFGRFVVALGALSLGLLVTGCDRSAWTGTTARTRGALPPRASDSPARTAAVWSGTSPARAPMREQTQAPMQGWTWASRARTCRMIRSSALLQLQTGLAAAEGLALPESHRGDCRPRWRRLQAVRSAWRQGGASTNRHLTVSLSVRRPSRPPFPRRSAAPPRSWAASSWQRRHPAAVWLYKAGNFPGRVLVYDTAAASSTLSPRPVTTPPRVSTVASFSTAWASGRCGRGRCGHLCVEDGGHALPGLEAGDLPGVHRRGGFTAVTSNGVAVLGYSDTTDWSNHLLAVAPGVYTPAFTAGTTLALSDTPAPAIYSTTDDPTLGLSDVAGFGQGVALHRSVWPNTHDVSRIELTLGATDSSSVTAGALACAHHQRARLHQRGVDDAHGRGSARRRAGRGTAAGSSASRSNSHEAPQHRGALERLSHPVRARRGLRALPEEHPRPRWPARREQPVRRQGGVLQARRVRRLRSRTSIPRSCSVRPTVVAPAQARWTCSRSASRGELVLENSPTSA